MSIKVVMLKSFFCVGLLLLCNPFQVSAAELAGLKGSAIPIPKGMENRIMFWVDIFARYGEDSSVFHHRDYPEIVYSVIDFKDIKKQHDYHKFRKLRDQLIDHEKQRIRRALNDLASGGRADSQLKRRIVQIFEPTIGATKSNYRQAADVEVIRAQTGIMERFRFGVQRSFRYMHVLEEVFRQQGLPPELARLPLIESSFNYEARSSVGAAGIWQFMPATAKSYMRVDNYIDERLDPIIASRAAAKYLANAYRNLQTWPLAVTSYNHGVSGMMRAVKQVGTRDFPTIVRRYDSKTFGFASKNFYVELLAANEVQKNWKRYFPDLERESPVYFDEIQIRRAISFPELVRISGVPREELQRLNLGFKDPITQGRVPVPAGYVLKTPKNVGNSLLAKLGSGAVLSVASSQPEQRRASAQPELQRTSDVAVATTTSDAWNGQYRVQKGDSLGKIASRVGASQAEILSANNLANANRIREGQLLRVPTNSRPKEPAIVTAQPASSAAGAARYIVRSGDTIGKIAQTFALSSSELMKINGMDDPRKLRAGQVLVVAGGETASVAAAPEAQNVSKYTVKKGDTLYSISRQLNVSLDQLKAKNKGLSNNIRPGQSLVY